MDSEMDISVEEGGLEVESESKEMPTTSKTKRTNKKPKVSKVSHDEEDKIELKDLICTVPGSPGYPLRNATSQIESEMYILEVKMIQEIKKYLKYFITERCIRKLAFYFLLNDKKYFQAIRKGNFFPTRKWISEFRKKYKLLKSDPRSKNLPKIDGIYLDYHFAMPKLAFYINNRWGCGSQNKENNGGSSCCRGGRGSCVKGNKSRKQKKTQKKVVLVDRGTQVTPEKARRESLKKSLKPVNSTTPVVNLRRKLFVSSDTESQQSSSAFRRVDEAMRTLKKKEASEVKMKMTLSPVTTTRAPAPCPQTPKTDIIKRSNSPISPMIKDEVEQLLEEGKNDHKRKSNKPLEKKCSKKAKVQSGKRLKQIDKYNKDVDMNNFKRYRLNPNSMEDDEVLIIEEVNLEPQEEGKGKEKTRWSPRTTGNLTLKSSPGNSSPEIEEVEVMSLDDEDGGGGGQENREVFVRSDSSGDGGWSYDEDVSLLDQAWNDLRDVIEHDLDNSAIEEAFNSLNLDTYLFPKLPDSELTSSLKSELESRKEDPSKALSSLNLVNEEGEGKGLDSYLLVQMKNLELGNKEGEKEDGESECGEEGLLDHVMAHLSEYLGDVSSLEDMGMQMPSTAEFSPSSLSELPSVAVDFNLGTMEDLLQFLQAELARSSGSVTQDTEAAVDGAGIDVRTTDTPPKVPFYCSDNNNPSQSSSNYLLVK